MENKTLEAQTTQKIFEEQVLKMRPFEIVISTSRLSLEPISIKYVYEIHRGFNYNVSRFLFTQTSNNIEKTKASIRNALKRMHNKTGSYFIVRSNATFEFLGCAGVRHSTNVPKPAFWIKDNMWGKGFGSEILSALRMYVSEFCEYENMYVTIEIGNFRAKKLIEKAGAIPQPQFLEKCNSNKKLKSLSVYYLPHI